MQTLIPKGFKFSTASGGFKTEGRRDLALVVSDSPATGAGVFTLNEFKAAPVLVAQESLSASSKFKAVVINTGQANACTGEEGLVNCRATLEMIARATGLDSSSILPGSTGVIGAQLKMDLWEKAMPELAANIGKMSAEGFAKAIMTTDSFPKYASTALQIDGKTVTILGIAKGAGMICPNMATMLCVLLCDAEIKAKDWQELLSRATQASFNRVTVDGDTSTNDSIFALANGESGVAVESAGQIIALEAGVTDILAQLAYKLVQDGEGATKVIHINVKGAASDDDAEKAARTVGHSPLVKTAMYGQDANWGRIVAALGRSGAKFSADDVRVSLAGIEIFRDGQPVPEDHEEELAKALKDVDIHIDIILGAGRGEYWLLASDLTHKYVDINADYRS